ncbi:tryptophanyl-tRNA synthetase, putative [Ichthyophthirius multifiliis]|uniref:tryptophan--tRNA ligase n=1 Tax=Ichthyophthirius multifiliis TaxID=5932 RepID=G0R267_ICHMU|nr:tryptophanyl-tRNA synthetase, putative [Ichthyophthirius multifiliis]EGR28434.1 tryptophanyl-tRNA synthetase, putative [Ichthyophthirius multifiliis]|eukprot:XP_004029670.1 tryptophanyl-tRNA synthetase, putative [Ichthyophthirius multifiliis]
MTYFVYQRLNYFLIKYRIIQNMNNSNTNVVKCIQNITLYNLMQDLRHLLIIQLEKDQDSQHIRGKNFLQVLEESENKVLQQEKMILYSFSQFPYEIIENQIYIGNIFHSNSQYYLNDLKITHLLDFCFYDEQKVDLINEYKLQKYKYKSIPLQPNIEIQLDFDEINQYIQDCLQEQNARILIYCKKDIIFSGIQPTGNLHLGNYLGAIKNWVRLQQNYMDKAEIYFQIADLHALTDKYKQVPYHAELAWILGCIAPQNWLNTMTQYKDKKSKNSSLGLYSYPVLMAADILLYNATLIPVGNDQKQHLELTKNYANRFNSLFQKGQSEGIIYPKYLESEFPRVMSLKDATKKMSKSESADSSRINLIDSPELIYDKIKKAKTDSISSVILFYKNQKILFQIKLDINRPEVYNLLKIYQTLSGLSIQQIEDMFQNKNMKQFKESLTELLVKTICPIGIKIEELLQNKDIIQDVLEAGNKKANDRAKQNIMRLKKEMGMLVF